MIKWELPSRILTAEESAKIDKKDGISAIDMGMQTFYYKRQNRSTTLSRAISDHLGWNMVKYLQSSSYICIRWSIIELFSSRTNWK